MKKGGGWVEYHKKDMTQTHHGRTVQGALPVKEALIEKAGCGTGSIEKGDNEIQRIDEGKGGWAIDMLP